LPLASLALAAEARTVARLRVISGRLLPAIPHSQDRPAGVTAFACFFGFGTLASGLSAISLLTPAGPLEPMWRLNPHARESLSRMGAWAPLLLGAVSLACAASVYGFFAGRRWGYRLGVALLLLNVTGDLVNASLGIEPRGFVGVPMVVLLLWYLFSRKVRGFFGFTRRETGVRRSLPGGS